MLAELRPSHAPSVPLQGTAFDLLTLEFAVSALAEALEVFGNLNSAVLFAATARASGPFDPTPANGRPVSINALAASLDRPFETTRRHANALIDDGLIQRTPAGLSVAAEAMVEPRVVRLVNGCHDLMVRLVEDLQSGDHALPPSAADASYDPRSGIGVALDLMLAAIECHGRREQNFTRLALLLAIEWAQHRVTLAGTSTFAKPTVRTSMAARLLGLPYATTSRNIDALVESGALARIGTGLRVVENQQVEENRSAFANRARQIMGRLAQSGFPMEQPGSAYIHQRPEKPGPV